MIVGEIVNIPQSALDKNALTVSSKKYSSISPSSSRKKIFQYSVQFEVLPVCLKAFYGGTVLNEGKTAICFLSMLSCSSVYWWFDPNVVDFIWMAIEHFLALRSAMVTK